MGLVLAGLGVLIFSFSLPLTKIVVRGLDPTVAAIGRAAVASVLAVIALLIRKPSVPTRRQAAHLVPVIGGVIFGFPLLIAYALRHTESLHGSVVNGLLPCHRRAGRRARRRAPVAGLLGVQCGGARRGRGLRRARGRRHVARCRFV